MTSRNVRTFVKLGLILFTFAACVTMPRSAPPITKPAIPDGFVDLASVAPDIQIEIRYATAWNFYGQPVPGYHSNRCYLTREAATALAKVQEEVSKQGYSLLVFDCYRPQRAVDAFVKWTEKGPDSTTKAFFYPAEERKLLIKRGYIASKSGHSRGSVVDLTLVKKDAIPTAAEGNLRFREHFMDCRTTKGTESTGQLDMGTAFDCFSELSHTDSSKISEKARKNRRLLKSAMEKHGFVNYELEWWHFVLKDEPFKDHYFDFEVL